MSVTFGSDWVYGVLLILILVALIITNLRISRLREDIVHGERINQLTHTHEWIDR